MRAALAASTLALLLGSSALAGPKPPTSAVFEPEIGYTYASGNYMDLRLANRAGDKAILVHRTAFGALGSFDLSDEQSKRIAYNDSGGLFVRSWKTINGSVSIGQPATIYDGPGRVEIADFSPGGHALAFSFGSTPDFPDRGGIIVHDYRHPDDPATGTNESQSTVLENWQVFTVRWEPGGASLYFYGRRIGSSDPAQLYLLDLSALPIDPFGLKRFPSPQAPITFSGAPITFDVFGLGTGVPPIPRLAVSSNTQTEIYEDIGTQLGTLTLTSLAHFNCNGLVIARDHRTRRQSVAIRQVYPSIGQPVTWSTDSNIHHTDWMYRVPCL